MIVAIPGPVAQDKDIARKLRCNQILPAVVRGDPVVLDFSSVDLATQSFVHALVSEVFRLHGERAVELVEFRACKTSVRAVAETVAQYSLQAKELAHRTLGTQKGQLSSLDVPQADRLATVRRVVDAVARGAVFAAGVAESCGYSMRHTHYRLHAARLLGFVRMHSASIVLLTRLGESLTATRAGGDEEREVMEKAIRRSRIIATIAPRLLSNRPPTVREIARRIQDSAGLSASTAERRARVLLGWRSHVLQYKLR